MLIPRPNSLKRRVLLGGSLSACLNGAPALGASLVQTLTRPVNLNAMQPLIHALQVGNLPVCLAAAQRLASLGGHARYFDLHLRGAELDTEKALRLAHAIGELSTHNLPRLRSFSASNNPGIGERGVAALIAALPSDLVELGLVSCGLGDHSGEQVLELMLRGTGWQMVCVEGNDFSQTMRSRMQQASLALKGCLFVVKWSTAELWIHT